MEDGGDGGRRERTVGRKARCGEHDVVGLPLTGRPRRVHQRRVLAVEGCGLAVRRGRKATVLLIGILVVGAALALTALAIAAAFESVFGLPAAYQFLSRTRAAGDRLVEIVECEPSVRFEAFSDRVLPGSCGVDFNGVSFRYAPGLPWALENVDLTVPAGRRLAVVGESGAGKSTLVSLLVRFFDPATGQIRIGGADTRKLSEPDLRRAVVVVSQQSHLFFATVRENLLVARPNADDAALRRALSAARLADVVDRLPDGLDTWIGEAGRLLSAGQARRLAVARAILRDAPVWVLDEPTEGLDRRTESELVESLLVGGRGQLLFQEDQHTQELIPAAGGPCDLGPGCHVVG